MCQVCINAERDSRYRLGHRPAHALRRGDSIVFAGSILMHTIREVVNAGPSVYLVFEEDRPTVVASPVEQFELA